MWINRDAMRAKFKATKEDAMDLLMYILVEDRNDRTIVPRYFWGREQEMVELLAEEGVKVSVYIRDGVRYVRKEADA